jgi:hypothetical protein
MEESPSRVTEGANEIEIVDYNVYNEKIGTMYNIV